ncbi:MAG: SAM-dependent methyltransferase [Candidatus Aenigmarchaeota archaeon]|nr:SAM-dependent methyltransferase [Candidatus Aenigmarchaeota archaeon]
MTMPVNIAVYFALVVFLLFAFISFWPVFTGANWEPTPMKKVKRMLDMARVTKRDYVYDLGFGDGRILFAALGRAAKAGGSEIEPIKWLAVKIYATIKKTKLDLRLGSAYSADLRKATVVAMFMTPLVNKIIAEKLSKLKKGTRIVSYHWPFPQWKPVRVDTQARIYVYETGKL